jgi:flavin reductase (DIM6/NTAB) family NADH-FMN oxidoreductase RutF
MRIDPATLHVRDMYQYLIGAITPRPIAWVSTISPNNIPNLAPFSFFNGVAANPPTVVFSPVNRRDGSKKDTVLNLEKTPEFVVNIVSDSLAVPMNDSSAEFAYEVSEFDKCGVTPLKSEKVKPPRVQEAKIHMECVVHQIVHVGEGPLAANLVIGKIVLMHVSEDVLDEKKQIDPAKLDTIGRMGGEWYSRTRDRFALTRPDRK